MILDLSVPFPGGFVQTFPSWAFGNIGAGSPGNPGAGGIGGGGGGGGGGGNITSVIETSRLTATGAATVYLQGTVDQNDQLLGNILNL